MSAGQEANYELRQRSHSSLGSSVIEREFEGEGELDKLLTLELKTIKLKAGNTEDQMKSVRSGSFYSRQSGMSDSSIFVHTTSETSESIDSVSKDS